MKKQLLLSAVLITASLTVACKSKHKDAAKAPIKSGAPVNELADLEKGTWSKCEISGMNHGSSDTTGFGAYSKVEIKFDGGILTKTSASYNSDDCSGSPTSEVSIDRLSYSVKSPGVLAISASAPGPQSGVQNEQAKVAVSTWSVQRNGEYVNIFEQDASGLVTTESFKR